MNRREWCRGSLAAVSALAYRPFNSLAAETVLQNRIRRLLAGNYELHAEVTAPKAVVSFSGREDWPIDAALEITSGNVTVVRRERKSRLVLKEQKLVGAAPWKIRLLKKGNFFRFWINDTSGWICDPLGIWETNHPTHQAEPERSYVGVETLEGRITSCSVTMLPWLPSPESPVIRAGPEGTFKEDHVLVGGIVEYNGSFYQYFSGSRHGCQEGGGAREIGVAESKDLVNWTIQPEPILKVGAKQSWEPTGLYCSGAVVTPEGKIAVMYAAQNFPEWGGFGLAFADYPLGPFQKFAGNPVYKHFSHAHEFDLVQTNEPGRRYLLFYSGFTPNPHTGPAGDRGYLLYSDDLVHWQAHERNPVFAPETTDNWDAVHVRPRSLAKIGDTWYLWYEGTNHWDPPSKASDPVRTGWWDTVGLARSRNLEDWEYYPRNPALPAAGISKERFDVDWVGWPRMFVRNGTGYIFYTGGRQIGLRTIAIDQLTDWKSEGGKSIQLL